ncbi:MAG: undecaprenyl-diphosphatase UppP [Dehalococcoidia bacterium]|nr:undecaprenyl-diphosphatase UppP [Dehalococcoidia bacterium]
MEFWQALVLGLVQGLTEFIPISSTGHLTIVGRWMGLIDPADPEKWTAFPAVVQLGTLLAVLWYFLSDIVKITRGFIIANLSFGKMVGKDNTAHSKMGWLIILGTLPIAIVGLVFKNIIEGDFTKNLLVISCSIIGFAIVLFAAEKIGSRKRDMDNIRWQDAAIVGISQVFSLVPGASRSGTTISGGLIAGLKRETAARFSFLLSIPAVAASGLLELPKAMHSLDTPLWILASAIAVAAVSGYMSIAFLLKFLQKNSSLPFVYYRIGLGVVLLALLISGKVSTN